MKTERLDSTPGGIARAAELLARGAIVAIPTETVYGLAGDATRADTAQRIFAAKGRPSNNPLIVHVATVDAARALATEWPVEADLLAAAFWPGPLTIVLPSAPTVAREVRAGGDTVGLRLPGHPVARAVIEACGVPLAAPSANSSGSLSPTRAEHVLADLDGRIDAVLDAGPCAVGIESTVVLLESAGIRLLRPGMIDGEALAATTGRPLFGAPAVVAAGAPLPSPGLLDRHYAPRVPLRLAGRGELVGAPSDAAVLSLAAPIGHPNERVLPPDPASYAAILYAALWDAQAGTVSAIWLETPPATLAWRAILDRLARAARPE